jgi:hypothetical protein
LSFSNLLQRESSPVAALALTSIHFTLVTCQFLAAFFSDVRAHEAVTYHTEDGEQTPLLGHHIGDADDVKNQRKPCPKETASFVSLVFFWWFTP